MKYRQLIVIVMVLIVLPGSACDTATDITGTWAFSVSLEGGPLNISTSFILKQEGEKLTGAPAIGSSETKVTGTVKGNKVAFTVDERNSGDPLKYTYTGMIESATRMSGTCEYPKGPGKWTATKSEP